MATIDIDDQRILAALRELHGLTNNLRPAFAEIGEELLESTKCVF